MTTLTRPASTPSRSGTRLSAAGIVIGLLLSCGVHAQDGFVRLEAEDMTLSGYRTEDVSGSSNGVLINLKGRARNGTATTTFSGASGGYDIFVGYHDEQDGTAELEVSIAGSTVDSWLLDNSPGGTQPGAQNFLIRQIATNRAVNSGDEIEIAGVQGVWDNANVDYVEFVPAGGGPPPPATGERVALVAPEGGDYVSLTDALDNLDSGDQWCRPPVDDEEPDVGCLIKVAPGEYVENTIRVPSKVSIIGSGREITTIVAAPGIDTAVRLSPDSQVGGDMLLRDLAVRIRTTDAGRTVGIDTNDELSATIENVAVIAQGSGVTIAVNEADIPGTNYRNVHFSARSSGDRAVGLRSIGLTRISDCVIAASGASDVTGILVTAERGDETALLEMSGCRIRVNAPGGPTAVGVDLVWDESSMELADSHILVGSGVDSNIGIAGRANESYIDAKDVVVAVDGPPGSVNTAIAWRHTGAATATFQGVRGTAERGATNTGIVLTGASSSGTVSIVDSTFDGGQGTQQHFGLVLDQPADARINVDGSRLAGSSAALSAPTLPAGAEVRIGGSQLAGPLVVPGTVTSEVRCAGVYDDDYNFFGGACPP